MADEAASLLGSQPPQAAADPAPAADPAKQPQEQPPQPQEQPPKAEEPAPSYDDLKLPEGVGDDDAKAFKQLAAEVKLPADKAQAIVDLHAAMVQRQVEAWNAQGEKWAEDVARDPELGGAKLADTKADIGRAMERFGSPDLRRLLEDIGIGNHPELVRFVARIGREFREDTLAPGRASAVDPLKALYPNSPELFRR